MTADRPYLELFSTCPQSKDIQNARDYRQRVAEIAAWSERAGYRGILIYTDNGLVDPWLVARMVIDATDALCPLVAVQPAYMHPYTVAKMVTSIGHLYRRRIYLNMVAGGFRNDLIAIGDNTAHDARYDRLVEYTLIVKRLLSGETISFDGNYFQVRNLSLSPALEPQLLPEVFVSGSSPAGVAAAKKIGATAVKYPQPPAEEVPAAADGSGAGMRVGIITRANDAHAWDIARARFPEDRRGQVTHALAMKVSDSQWHRQLSRLGRSASTPTNPYWLRPFENYKTFCPYLVGSYERVGEELAHYLRLGFATFILDIPPSQEELEHTAIAFELAVERAGGVQNQAHA